jgi:hypothetical protein
MKNGKCRACQRNRRNASQGKRKSNPEARRRLDPSDASRSTRVTLCYFRCKFSALRHDAWLLTAHDMKAPERLRDATCVIQNRSAEFAKRWLRFSPKKCPEVVSNRYMICAASPAPNFGNRDD